MDIIGVWSPRNSGTMTPVEARAGIGGRLCGSTGGLALGETTTTGSAVSSWARAGRVKKIVAASAHSVCLSRMGDPSPAVLRESEARGDTRSRLFGQERSMPYDVRDSTPTNPTRKRGKQRIPRLRVELVQQDSARLSSGGAVCRGPRRRRLPQAATAVEPGHRLKSQYLRRSPYRFRRKYL